MRRRKPKMYKVTLWLTPEEYGRLANLCPNKMSFHKLCRALFELGHQQGQARLAALAVQIHEARLGKKGAKVVPMEKFRIDAKKIAESIARGRRYAVA